MLLRPDQPFNVAARASSCNVFSLWFYREVSDGPVGGLVTGDKEAPGSAGGYVSGHVTGTHPPAEPGASFSGEPLVRPVRGTCFAN